MTICKKIFVVTRLDVMLDVANMCFIKGHVYMFFIQGDACGGCWWIFYPQYYSPDAKWVTSASLTCLALSYTVLISGDDDDQLIMAMFMLMRRRMCMTMMTMLMLTFDPVCHKIFFYFIWKMKEVILKHCQEVQKGKQLLIKLGIIWWPFRQWWPQQSPFLTIFLGKSWSP